MDAPAAKDTLKNYIPNKDSIIKLHTTQFMFKIAALLSHIYNNTNSAKLFLQYCSKRKLVPSELSGRTVPAEYCSLKYSPHPPKEHSEFPNPGRPLDV